jgi:hypothetical protein
MALVPYSHANPYADNRNALSRNFILQIPDPSANGRPNRVQNAPRTFSVSLKQNPTEEIDREKNTGFLVWEGSFVLAKHVVRNWGTWFQSNELRVVELGAGTGLCSIAAWLGSNGRAEVTATDIPEVCGLLRENVAANCEKLGNELGFDGSERGIRVQAVDWSVRRVWALDSTLLSCSVVATGRNSSHRLFRNRWTLF